VISWCLSGGLNVGIERGPFSSPNFRRGVYWLCRKENNGCRESIMFSRKRQSKALLFFHSPQNNGAPD
jgi:hypothetical protein